MAITSSNQACTCNRCGAKAFSLSGTQHRRCTGQPQEGEGEVKIRDKHDKLPSTNRGQWQ